ncbi:MAG: SPOR domain-containing protein [Chlorobiaceae bacterium]
MINRELTEELAVLLDLERQEAASLFNGFCGAMVAELLAFRKLSIKGLGSFYVTHVPASKRSSGSVMVFAPPLNKLRFESTLSGADASLSLAVSRLSMNQGEAAKFSRTLASLFSSALQQEKAIHLHGLGRFALEDGAYSFFPDRTMEELLNREYQDLKEVILPQHEVERRERRSPGYILPLAVVVLVGLLLAIVSGRLSWSTFSPSTVEPSKSVATVVDRSAGAVAPAPAPPPSVPKAYPIKTPGGLTDSLVLVKGDYAIVLATFETEKRAHQQITPLRSSGIKAFVWPTSMADTKYFRLMTGRFASYSAAAAKLKGMLPKMVEGAYIQQVKKTVVLHGEKGL